MGVTNYILRRIPSTNAFRSPSVRYHPCRTSQSCTRRPCYRCCSSACVHLLTSSGSSEQLAVGKSYLQRRVFIHHPKSSHLRLLALKAATQLSKTRLLRTSIDHGLLLSLSTPPHCHQPRKDLGFDILGRYSFAFSPISPIFSLGEYFLRTLSL